ncbi:hypothetical protein V5P93_000134 [Actinokineospora auranticolor]|uniref:Uncharacterized protein n=1 Tax=Actinokineospora auranticolor TaxID=155976 RepID=A0A2S6GBW0_9PSEU|nr:hypothetical protein [Actinokineospora auranticolor]PPK61704.1 hypothetical protein CLV40_1391 [Actinokineospora auranticolor]
MDSNFTVNAWARVDDGCDISFAPDGAKAMSLHFGGRFESFEITFGIQGLERLIDVATQARAELAKSA